MDDPKGYGVQPDCDADYIEMLCRRGDRIPPGTYYIYRPLVYRSLRGSGRDETFIVRKS